MTKKIDLSVAHLALLFEKYDQGVPIKRLAKECGYSYSGFWRYFKKKLEERREGK